MSKAVHIVCPECDAVNRVPQDRLGDRAKCGKCHTQLFSGRPLPLEDLLLLNHLWLDRRITTGEASRLTQKPESEVRGRLQRLVESGLVEAKGEGKGRVYHLSAETYRRLGQKSAYVRQRGFEPLQQEQMVLQYVVKHGRITRGETAELCKLSPDQAFRLLRRLVEAGSLRRHGKGKNAWYGETS